MKEYDGFNDWQGVRREYAGIWDDDAKLVGPEQEPEHVFAFYEYENYEGDSTVAYFMNGMFYLNRGSHCSCYGLEDQWDPEEYTIDTFKGMLDRLEGDDWGLGKHKNELLELYNAVMEPQLPL